LSDRQIVKMCSPTLAGLKTASLINISYDSREELLSDIRSLNKRLASKNIVTIPLKITDGRALVYIYRPDYLLRDLSCGIVRMKLKEIGYSCKSSTECISVLRKHIYSDESFPHEIGFFLGYPPEDVLGFMSNEGMSPKMSGMWKVYGDEKKASELFDEYGKCTRELERRFDYGCSIEQLAV